MMKKRGDIGIQFKWIFSILAGALILSFFIMIVTRQKEISEKKLSVDLLNDLDMIITGQAVSPGSSKTLDMAELELAFTCNDYSIKDTPKTSGNSLVFSPSKMKGASLLAWTLEWDMPYRAANFIYLTVPEIKYFIIDPAQANGEDSFGIKKDFPETVDLEVVSSTPADYEEHQRVRLVYFTGSEPAEEYDLSTISGSDGLKGFKDEQVSALYITGADDKEDFNGNAEMYFYNKKKDLLKREGSKVGSLGKEAVYGAIFTDDYELYMCNIEKAVKKLEIVTQVYKERANDIADSLPAGDPCSPYYSTGSLQGIVDTLNTAPLNTGNLYFYIKQIESQNERTVFGSCPEIY